MRIKLTGNKNEQISKLYSDMLDILLAVGIPVDGLPTDRRREKMAGACLAVGQIATSLREAKSVMNGSFLKTRDIIDFENAHYGEHISPGSYDDIRRKDLKMLVDDGLVINSSALDKSATNNPNRGYALDAQFANLIKAYGTKQWSDKLALFNEARLQIKNELAVKRASERIPVTLADGQALEFSPGEHNILQKKIIEQFLPQWGMGAQLLYVGDTADKYLYRDEQALRSLQFFPLGHEALPDIVAYNKEKNLLLLIEAVHSSGPMDISRVNQLKKMLTTCTADIAFFTAFLNRRTYQKFCLDIAWDTEVWIADAPDHLIHLNGYKFLEIHK